MLEFVLIVSQHLCAIKFIIRHTVRCELRFKSKAIIGAYYYKTLFR